MSLSLQPSHTILTDSEQGGHHEATVNFLNGIGNNGGLNDATDIIEVMAKEEAPHLRLTLLDVILRTTDEHALKELANSSKACRIYHEWIKDALKDTDWVSIARMLKVLDHLPFDIPIVTEFKLGKAVRIVRDRALVHDKDEMGSEATRIMAKWSEMNKLHNSKRELTAEKRKTPPTTITSPEKKPVRLALSDTPPPKPKAQARTNFELFNTLNPTETRKNDFLKREETYIVESPPSNNYSLNGWNGVSNSSSVAPSSSISSSSSRKRVSFKPDDSLTQIRYFEKESLISDPPLLHHEILTIGVTADAIDMWYRPARIHYDDTECRQPRLIETEESRSQRLRESMTPRIIYKSHTEIPDSPQEPDDLGVSNEMGVKEIPLEDQVVYDQEQEQATPEYVEDPIPAATTVTNAATTTYPGLDAYPQLQGLLSAVFSQQQQQPQQHQVPTQHFHEPSPPPPNHNHNQQHYHGRVNHRRVPRA
ncbi:hypothetical protein BJV82DRAFT_607168 [Fennellomyces sp. T-0311]|nr:hypothetical protein BJV82DRAFT_607168 [Fennellomyces sp. T-0311]